MKITASIDSKLGDRNLERGKTYDISETEAKHLLRAGLGRKASKNATVEKTVQAAKVDTPEGFEPGKDSSPEGPSNLSASNTSTTRSTASGKAGK